MARRFGGRKYWQLKARSMTAFSRLPTFVVAIVLTGSVPAGQFEPAYPRPNRETLLAGYQREFGFAPIPPPGPGVPQEKVNQAVAKIRSNLGVVREDNILRGKPLFQDKAKGLSLAGFFTVMWEASSLIDRASASQREELNAALRDTAAYLDTELLRWQKDYPHLAAVTDLPSYSVPPYDQILRASLIWPAEERSRFAHALAALIPPEQEKPAPELQMDALKARGAFAPCFAAGEDDPQVRMAMITAAADYFDRLLRAPRNLTLDGVPIHHGIWHYAYGSYSLDTFFHNVVRLHQAGWYLSPEAYQRIRRTAKVGAFLTAGFNNHVPFNLQGRAGCIDRIPVQDWLATAAAPGDGKDPTQPDPEFAGLLMALYPTDRCVTRFHEQGCKPSLSPLQGHVTINTGAAAAHRRGQWLACVSGQSPYTGKHEIYTWLQGNNYSLFVRRGVLLLLHPSYAADDFGFGLNSGFQWSFLPGATTYACQDIEMMSRAANTFVHNQGLAGATSLDADGVWGLNQVTGPGALFRKSMFFFDDRITVITTNIRRHDPKAKGSSTVGGYPSVPVAAPVVTTLFQWPLDNDTPTLVAGKEISGLTTHTVKKLRSSTWLVDRHGHGYYLHSAPTVGLYVLRQHQKFHQFYDRFLKDPNHNPIQWGEAWKADGVPIGQANLAKLREYYHPGEGDFELAFLDHLQLPSRCAYTVLPMAGKEKTREFAESAQSGKMPYRILAATEELHAVYDEATQTTGYVIFDLGIPNWPKESPLRGVSQPCYVMVRKQDEGFLLSTAFPGATAPLQLRLTGKWNLATDVAEVALRRQGGNDTILEFSSSGLLPCLVHLK